MIMLNGEKEESPSKKQHFISSTSEGGGGGLVQNNCAFINIISSAGVSVGDTLLNDGVVEEDGKRLKEE